jgi:hypothetical protein
MSHFSLPLLTYNCKLYNTQNIHFDYLVEEKGGGEQKVRKEILKNIYERIRICVKNMCILHLQNIPLIIGHQ